MIVDAPDRPHLPVEIQWVRLGDLSPDTGRPQRTLRKPIRIQRMIGSWMPSKCGALTVDRWPDGALHVVDGGHRWEAMMQLFGPDYLIPVVINDVDSITDDAEIFIGINRDRTAVAHWDQFKVALQGGMEPETTIAAILEKRDLGLASGASSHRIGCVATVMTIHRDYGGDILGLAVDVMAAAWGCTRETWSSDMLHGVALVLGRWESVDPAKLTHVLAKKPIQAWVSQGKNMAEARGKTYNGSKSRGTPVALGIMHDYNARTRGARRAVPKTRRTEP